MPLEKFVLLDTLFILQWAEPLELRIPSLSCLEFWLLCLAPFRFAVLKLKLKIYYLFIILKGKNLSDLLLFSIWRFLLDWVLILWLYCIFKIFQKFYKVNLRCLKVFWLLSWGFGRKLWLVHLASFLYLFSCSRKFFACADFRAWLVAHLEYPLWCETFQLPDEESWSSFSSLTLEMKFLFRMKLHSGSSCKSFSSILLVWALFSKVLRKIFKIIM